MSFVNEILAKCLKDRCIFHGKGIEDGCVKSIVLRTCHCYVSLIIGVFARSGTVKCYNARNFTLNPKRLIYRFALMEQSIKVSLLTHLLAQLSSHLLGGRHFQAPGTPQRPATHRLRGGRCDLPVRQGPSRCMHPTNGPCARHGTSAPTRCETNFVAFSALNDRRQQISTSLLAFQRKCSLGDASWETVLHERSICLPSLSFWFNTSNCHPILN
jgi:hypothetical protein